MAERAPKRTRQGTSRARTGCLTCKSRRVKCDEEKPNCRRCITVGRNCEYRNPVPTKPSKFVVKLYLAKTSTMYPQPSPLQNTCLLNVYHGGLAVKLDGKFDTKFWSVLVMQLVQTESAVRHAVSAIGAIHEDVERSLSKPKPDLINLNRTALEQWHAAITSLSERIQTIPNSALVPLVCCLLFICFEFFRGNVESAFVHIESGLKIISTVRDSKNIPERELLEIERSIVPLFSRLNIICTLFGRSMPVAYSVSTPSESPFDSLAEARQRLFEVLDVILKFIRITTEKSLLCKLNLDDYVTQAKLQTKLEQWLHQFQDFLAELPTSELELHEEAILNLKLNYKVVSIWLMACTREEETALDGQVADFEEMLQYAKQIIRLALPNSQPDSLSFDTQLIPPLYYAAVKCRQPELRRQALHLLQFAPRRESLWNAHHAFKAAQKVIELEEAIVDKEGLPVTCGLLYGVKHPSGYSRSYYSDVMPGSFISIDGNVMPHPAQPGTIEIVFQMKRSGRQGPVENKVEYINL